jgi:hypothetical protein
MSYKLKGYQIKKHFLYIIPVVTNAAEQSPFEKLTVAQLVKKFPVFMEPYSEELTACSEMGPY